MGKICSTCKLEKDLSCFAKHKDRKDGLQGVCKDCRKIYIRQHYLNNKKYYKDKAHNARIDNFSWFREYKKTLKCSKCGFNHPAALDFHHIEDNKEYNISQMISNYSIENILKEIEKCIILCANCHRILHSNI